MIHPSILYDSGFWLSLCLWFISLIGFIMFMKEWKRFGEATEIFVCVTMLFGSICFTQSVNQYGYYLYYTKQMVAYVLFSHTWWEWRNLPLLTCVTAIVYISMRRAHANNTIWMHLKRLFFGTPLPYIVTPETDRRHTHKIPFFKRRKDDLTKERN